MAFSRLRAGYFFAINQESLVSTLRPQSSRGGTPLAADNDADPTSAGAADPKPHIPSATEGRLRKLACRKRALDFWARCRSRSHSPSLSRLTANKHITATPAKNPTARDSTANAAHSFILRQPLQQVRFFSQYQARSQTQPTPRASYQQNIPKTHHQKPSA